MLRRWRAAPRMWSVGVVLIAAYLVQIVVTVLLVADVIGRATAEDLLVPAAGVAVLALAVFVWRGHRYGEPV
jgi:hypothetical protein